MDELEKYRERIEQRYNQRRKAERHRDGGRRDSDYKPPRFWTAGFVANLLALLIGGFILLVLSGCVAIKKSISGG